MGTGAHRYLRYLVRWIWWSQFYYWFRAKSSTVMVIRPSVYRFWLRQQMLSGHAHREFCKIQYSEMGSGTVLVSSNCYQSQYPIPLYSRMVILHYPGSALFLLLSQAMSGKFYTICLFCIHNRLQLIVLGNDIDSQWYCATTQRTSPFNNPNKEYFSCQYITKCMLPCTSILKYPTF